MKKFFSVLAVVAVAAVVVSCSSKVNEIGVSKGNKSQLDTLSYSWAINITNDMVSNVPELKFDWKVFADAAESSMLKTEAYEEDEIDRKSVV